MDVDWYVRSVADIDRSFKHAHVAEAPVFSTYFDM
jgi:hypothetical protein